MGQPSAPPLEDAKTVLDAKQHKSLSLCITGTRLSQVPLGINELVHLVKLDLSQNPLGQLPDNCFPPKLQELHVTGCGLTQLPTSLAHLQHLQKIFASANKLRDADVVFRCPALQHAGLAYNPIATLPSDLFLSSPLLSLDLSHNDLADLATVLQQLQLLPSLANLSLVGNPLSLSPSYQQQIRGSLRRLAYVDGQKLDPAVQASGASSRPVTVRTPVPNQLLEQGVVLPEGQDTCLLLHISGLTVVEDPYQQIKAKWQAELEAAQSATPPVPPSFSSLPPLMPTYYHLDVMDHEGTPYSSLPTRLDPPSPPQEEDPKAKAKEAGKKPPSARPGAKGGKGGEPDTPARPLMRGELKLHLGLPASVAARDFLRNGILVTVYRTTFEAKLKEVPADAIPPPTPTGGKGGKATPPPGAKAPPPKGKAAEQPDPKTLYDFTPMTSVLGTCTLRPTPLLNGTSFRSLETCQVIPVPAVFEEATGIRMALKDPRHSKEPKATLTGLLQLHVVPEGLQQQQQK